MQSKGKANSKADIQHDHLTALWNKEAGEELLDSCIRTAKAQSTSFLAVLLDINDLDTVNKRCGHQEGDRILQRVAEKIRSSLQTGDFAIRLGGDEFLLVFQQLSKKEVRNLLDQILNELEEESREFPYTMGFCFGITQIMADMELSVKKIIMRADDEMYLSKRRYHLEQYGQPVLFAGIITNLGRKNKIDYLSGQFNKYELEDTLQMMVAKEEHFFMMILDLDGFSSINKLYNHQFGDEVLAKTAQIIQSVLPEYARLYRNDGDEFIVLLRSCTNSNEIAGFYHRLQQELGHQRILNGKKYHCTVSAGCACFPKDGDDMMSLTKNVGYALEASKRNGKNRLTFYEKKMSETELQELDMLEQLRYSMEHDFEGFSLQYQPQVEADSGRIIAAEALARWHSSMYGNVSPVVFIPLLEKSGMILTIGKWIFETALRQCAAWLKKCPDFCVSVNLSYLQLYEEGFITFMKETLKKCHVPSRNIIVEMTESYMVKSSEELQAIFQEIRSIGVRIAMDDFGTGYSSLGVLKNSPADIVKIDRIFIKDILNSEFDATFIQFVVRLCHDVNIRVLLEGVETKAEYEKVKTMGLDDIQGYYFGKPMHPEKLEELLR